MNGSRLNKFPLEMWTGTSALKNEPSVSLPTGTDEILAPSQKAGMRKHRWEGDTRSRSELGAQLETQVSLGGPFWYVERRGDSI